MDSLLMYTGPAAIRSGEDVAFEEVRCFSRSIALLPLPLLLVYPQNAHNAAIKSAAVDLYVQTGWVQNLVTLCY